jgi:hypothetical protein
LYNLSISGEKAMASASAQEPLAQRRQDHPHACRAGGKKQDHHGQQ